MTGGTVVVLGNTGRNFAAGMSGGIAYVYDPLGDFASKCNTAMVSLDKVVSAAEQHLDRDAWHTQHRDGVPEADEVILKRLIERHFKHTGSTRARVLLDDWAAARGKFVKVFPNEYKRALIEMAADAAMEVQASPPEPAEMNVKGAAAPLPPAKNTKELSWVKLPASWNSSARTSTIWSLPRA